MILMHLGPLVIMVSKRTDVGISDSLTKRQVADRLWLKQRQQEYLEFEQRMNLVRQIGAFDFVGDGKVVRNRPYLTRIPVL